MFPLFPYFGPKLFCFPCIWLLVCLPAISHYLLVKSLLLFWNNLFCLYYFTLSCYLFNLHSFANTFISYYINSCLVIFICATFSFLSQHVPAFFICAAFSFLSQHVPAFFFYLWCFFPFCLNMFQRSFLFVMLFPFCLNMFQFFFYLCCFFLFVSTCSSDFFALLFPFCLNMFQSFFYLWCFVLSSRISHPSFEFSFVVFSGTPILSQTNFSPCINYFV